MNIDWTITVGSVLQMVLIIGFIIAAWVKIEKRLTGVEAEQESAREARRDILLQLRSLTIQTARLEGRISDHMDRDGGER